MYYYYRSLQIIWNRVLKIFGENPTHNPDEIALFHTYNLLNFEKLMECAGLNKFDSLYDKDEFEKDYRHLLDWSVDGVEIENAKDLIRHCWLQWIDPTQEDCLDDLLTPSFTGFERMALEELSGLKFREEDY